MTAEPAAMAAAAARRLLWGAMLALAIWIVVAWLLLSPASGPLASLPVGWNAWIGGLALLLAGAHLYWTARVCFDWWVFAGWARRWRTSGSLAAGDMAAFDRRLGRSAPLETLTPVLDLARRTKGAMGLVRRQTATGLGLLFCAAFIATGL
ncbi:hypothetical protein [Hydrogenophaga sp. 5NK40-0174]|uniref:hypothetical protein n=1 Tax=Hydrogenophaga sp. 5NK40-0174 TaxID=3127649 RepID=UPI00333E6153